MAHNYILNSIKYSYTLSTLVLTRLTKSDLKLIIDDYDIKYEKSPGGKYRSLQDYRTIFIQLNAALCIQKHVLQKYAKYTHINHLCPITINNPSIPLKLVFRASNTKPFNFFVSQYELEDFARYIMTTSNFVDINTQLTLSKLHIRAIDACILHHNLFLPSLFHLYTTTKKEQSLNMVNPQYEIQILITALERSMSTDVATLYDYIFDYHDITNQPLVDDVVKHACSNVIRTLHQIQKISSQQMQIVKSNISEHLRNAEIRMHKHNKYKSSKGTYTPHGIQYIFDKLSTNISNYI